MSSWSRIDVCICTFRRDSLADTVRSIAAQGLPPGTGVRVIIVDNDDTPSASSRAEQICIECGVEFLYLHAPARNISIARNMCISSTDSPLVAFIDDYETATPGWLAELLRTMTLEDADVVFGPVQAVYDEDAPAWLRRADLHSSKPVIGPDGTITTGYTSNVLIRRAALEAAPQLRFNEALGRSGGEDTVFFHDLHDSGARMAFSPGAFVQERVPPHRSRMSWLVRRAFRMGQTHGWLLNKKINGGKIGAVGPQIGLAAAKSMVCLAAAVLGLGSDRVWRRQCFRAALHAGVVAKLSGFKDVTLY